LNSTRIPGVAGGRPPSVTLAVYALSLALLLGVAILGFGWGYPSIALITLVTIGGLILGVARRHNWARWALLVVTVLALALTWPVVRFQLTYGVVLPLATVVQLALEAVAFVLLFRPPARRWYRGPHASTA
jgi:hypothetical protein